MPKSTTVLALPILGSLLTGSAMADTTLVENGRSPYSIVVPSGAPATLINAARELQLDIQLATGTQLPLREDNESVATPFISLGITRQSGAAGLGVVGLKDEGYRIVTDNGNLFILGIDTPSGGWTSAGGISTGTANGIYSFLQEYLGVRWLMPGDLGRDVPSRKALSLPDLNRTETPLFRWRRLSHLSDYADSTQLKSINQWMDRQKLGGAVQIDYEHNWWRAMNDFKSQNSDTPAIRAIYQQHPEWFAMDASGKRPFPTSKFGKLESTNQELVRWFADKAIQTLKESPRPTTFSLSPSDGSSWSQSPESKALYDPSPSNLFDPEAPAGLPGMSSLVLKWYQDVAEIVQREYPEGQLAGYIYSIYVYPPKKFAMQLPENFTPVICGIGTYGYGLYREDNRQRFTYVMDSWTKNVPNKGWFYYDLPNQMLRQDTNEIGPNTFPGSTAIVTPAAPEILDFLFTTLVRDRIAGTYLYGVPSWSNAAMANYILAQMQWNPKLKATDLQREWLVRSYGPKAGQAMAVFHEKLNSHLGEYFRAHPTTNYKLTVDILKQVYAENYSELEGLFLAAKAQTMTAPQKERLQLMEDNLRVLQWRLRNAGMLPEGLQSPLRSDDFTVNELLTRYNPAFPLFPGALSPTSDAKASKPLPWKVRPVDIAFAPASTTPAAGLGDGRFLIYAARDTQVKIVPRAIMHGPYFASYELRDETGRLMTTGILSAGKTLEFAARAGKSYILFLADRKNVNYELLVESAAIAEGQVNGGELGLSTLTAPIYIYYSPDKSPIGAYQTKAGAVLKKPFSGSVAATIMGDAYTNVRVLAHLDDGWKFNPDPNDSGFDRGFTAATFDDRAWKNITAMDWWQMQGFPYYHGAAWYRTKFELEALPATDRARLYFGAIDGNAEIYLNGKRLPDHKLGENFEGWNKAFSNNAGNYLVPGENILAVKVTSKNNESASGIFKGASLVAGTRKP